MLKREIARLAKDIDGLLDQCMVGDGVILPNDSLWTWRYVVTAGQPRF